MRTSAKAIPPLSKVVLTGGAAGGVEIVEPPSFGFRLNDIGFPFVFHTQNRILANAYIIYDSGSLDEPVIAFVSYLEISVGPKPFPPLIPNGRHSGTNHLSLGEPYTQGP